MTTHPDLITPAADILVVDDNIASLKLLSGILIRAGYRVRPAERPQLALASALAQPPSLILLDVKMPEMSGFEVCRRVKQDERTRDIPVIFLSALHNVDDKVLGFEAGGVDFVSKPFQEVEVLARVKTHLQLYTMQVHLEELMAERTGELTQTNEALQTEIAERLKVEEERDYIYNVSHDLICIANRAGYIKYFNPAWERVLGYTKTELLARPFSDYIHPGDRARSRAQVVRLVFDEQMFDFENRIICKDGSIRTISWNTTPLPEVQAAYYYGRDITEQTAARDALRANEIRLDLAIEATGLGIWDYDVTSDHAVWDKVCVEMLGYALEELPPARDTWLNLLHPDDKDRASTLLAQHLADDQVHYDLDFRLKCKSGAWKWIHARGKVVQRDENGCAQRMIGTHLDISRRQQVDAALRESEEKFKTLVTNTEEIVYMIAKDGTFLLSEGKGLANIGLKPGQVVGKSVFEMYKDYPEMLAAMRRSFNGESVIIEVHVAGIDFRNWYTPHINVEGEIIGLMGLSINITEQKLAEKKLQDYQQRLRALASELTLTEERERRNIALDLHDQVGQSLAVMRMQLAMAQNESGSRKVVAILDEVSGALRAAIQDTRHVITDLNSPLIIELGLAAALSEWLTERIGKRYGLETQFIDDGDPKPLNEDTGAILFRSIRELLTNVVKHANAKRVSVSLQRRGSTIQIVVEDDGVGLTDGKHPKKDSTESGFGLFSIEERMSDLNGSLEIESHAGQGFKAILTAPLKSGD